MASPGYFPTFKRLTSRRMRRVWAVLAVLVIAGWWFLGDVVLCHFTLMQLRHRNTVWLWTFGDISGPRARLQNLARGSAYTRRALIRELCEGDSRRLRYALLEVLFSVAEVEEARDELLPELVALFDPDEWTGLSRAQQQARVEILPDLLHRLSQLDGAWANTLAEASLAVIPATSITGLTAQQYITQPGEIAPLWTSSAMSTPLTPLAFRPDGRSLFAEIVSGDTAALIEYDAESGSETDRWDLGTLGTWIVAVGASGDSAFALRLTLGRSLERLDLTPGAVLAPLGLAGAGCETLRISGDGSLVLLTGASATEARDAVTGQIAGTLAYGAPGAWPLENSCEFILADNSGGVIRWNPRTGTTQTLNTSGASVLGALAVCSLDGRRLAAPSGNGVSILDSETGALESDLTLPIPWPRPILFLPGDFRLLVGSIRGLGLSIIDAQTVARVTPLRSWGTTNVAACSPDGRWLATEASDGRIRVFDLSAISASPEPD